MGADIRTTWPRFRTEAGRERHYAAYDAALANWPVPLEPVRIPTRLGHTNVLASGPRDGAALVLLPSLAATALVWRANVEALSQTRRVYAVDVIGQPGRSIGQRPIRSVQDYVGWLSDVLDGLEVGRATLVGCSYGGFLAASYALGEPDRVERMVLIGPAGVFSAIPWMLGFRMRFGAARRQIARLLGRQHAPAAARLHAAAAPLHYADDAWRSLMAVTLAEAPTLSLARPRTFSRMEFDRIAAPMLLLIGEYEQLYDPHATLQRARSLKPGIEAEIVPGADHIAAMAQPEWVNARIAAFVGG
jgi:pimeloyl-ACP methyl ester carboxylesterase